MLNSSRLVVMILRVLVLSLTFLATFMVTVLLVLIPLRYLFGIPLGSNAGLILGIVCGLVVWLFVAVFHIRCERVRWSFDNRAAFAQLVRENLDDLGYEVAEQTPDLLVSRPSFKAYLLGGQIRVEYQSDAAIVTGPKVFLEILRRRLRTTNHLAKVQQTLSSGDVNLGRVHKRVQIGLRIGSHQWRGVEKEILEYLTLAGAEVVCDVEILAKSEQGVNDLILEQHIRSWLKRERICARIIKDPSQWDEDRWSGASLGMDDTEINAKIECPRLGREGVSP